MRAPALFLPGWGAPVSLYEPGLPAEWRGLDLPTFAAARGSLANYRRWLGRELRRRGHSQLGGHSMGAALALLAAADAPGLVERLVLVAPAGLPLQKPIRSSLHDFWRQLGAGVYPPTAALRAMSLAARAPRAAVALAREVRALDLRRECRAVRHAGIPTVVVGCASDTLVTTAHAQVLADALGADYRELALDGGHMWMLNEHAALAGVLRA
jgi:pimeloyl-ACP methyl ester carboxylesterase